MKESENQKSEKEMEDALNPEPDFTATGMIYREPVFKSMKEGDTIKGVFEGMDMFQFGAHAVPVHVICFSRNELDKSTGEQYKQLYMISASYKLAKFCKTFKLKAGETFLSITLTEKKPHPKKSGLSLNEYSILAANLDGTPVEKRIPAQDEENEMPF